MKLFRIVSKKGLVLSVFFSLLTGLDTFVMPVIVNGVTDAVLSRNTQSLLYVTLYGLVGYIFLQFTLYLWQKSLLKVAYDFNLQVKTRIFRHALKKDTTTEEIQSVIYNDLPNVEEQYLRSVLQLIYCLWFSSVSLIYVLSISWQVSLIFILFSAFPLVLPRLFEARLQKKSEIWMEKNEIYTKELNENLTNIGVIRHYRRLSFFLQRYVSVLTEREEATYAKGTFSLLVTFVINSISVIAGILPFGIGGWLAIQGQLSVGGLIAVFLASDRVLSPLENAIHYWNQIKSSQPLCEKMERLIFSHQELGEEKAQKMRIRELEFQEAGIGYDRALFQLTDRVRESEKILIVGPSGAGKSTIFKTLFQQIPLLSGYIVLNGQNLSSLSQETLYSSMGYISQIAYIFDESLAFNICLGEEVDQERLELAIERAGLRELVQEKGLNYRAGVNGESLSGGERARLILARIFLRDYSLVLIDEFSASLDKDNASQIRKTLLASDMTIIEIAHHFTDKDKEEYDRIWEIQKEARQVLVRYPNK